MYMGSAGDGVAGLVVAPHVVNEAILCAFWTDVGSVSSVCEDGTQGNFTHGGCLPGCWGATKATAGMSAWCGTPEPLRIWLTQGSFTCPYSPANLEDMLQVHERRAAGASCRCCEWPGCPLYNEVVIDARVWLRHLPGAVEAVYYPKGSRAAEVEARRVHGAFLAAFSLDEERMPLMTIDIWNHDQPFAEAPKLP